MRECTYILNVCASWRSSIEFTEGGLGDQSLNTSYQHREIIIWKMLRFAESDTIFVRIIIDAL